MGATHGSQKGAMTSLHLLLRSVHVLERQPDYFTSVFHFCSFSVVMQSRLLRWSHECVDVKESELIQQIHRRRRYTEAKLAVVLMKSSVELKKL